MIVYRLSKSAFSLDLSGRGAERCGGRWNSKGMAMVYTSQSRALCTAEIAVHVPLGIIPMDYEIITIEIPDDSEYFVLPESQLPGDWRVYPPPYSTQRLGDTFIKKNEFLVMKVPSVVVSGDYNFLLNPYHKDMNNIKIISHEAFVFDTRLFMR